jgi:molybdenum cofactor sulfurtransferase
MSELADKAVPLTHPNAGEPAAVDELRGREYARLDAGGHVYFDYTGAGLYAPLQLDEHLALLRDSVFGNPHSLNPTSAAMTELVEDARAAAPARSRSPSPARRWSAASSARP